MKNKGLSALCVLLALCLAAGAFLFFHRDAQNRQQIAALTAESAEKGEKIDALSAENAGQAAQIEALMAESAERGGKIDALSAENAGQAAQIEALTAESAEKGGKIDALSAENAEQGHRLEALSGEIAQAAAQAEALTAENASLREDLNKNTVKISALQAANDKKAARIDQLTKKLPTEDDLFLIEEGTYTATKRLIRQLLRQGFSYSFYPPAEEGGDDILELRFRSDSDAGQSFPYDVAAILDSANTRLSLRVWNLIDFRAVDLDDVRLACDKANARWMWITFYVDESDYSVTASYDMLLPHSSASGPLMWEAIEILDSILSTVYDDLAPFNIKKNTYPFRHQANVMRP